MILCKRKRKEKQYHQVQTKATLYLSYRGCWKMRVLLRVLKSVEMDSVFPTPSTNTLDQHPSHSTNTLDQHPHSTPQPLNQHPQLTPSINTLDQHPQSTPSSNTLQTNTLQTNTLQINTLQINTLNQHYFRHPPSTLNQHPPANSPCNLDTQSLLSQDSL